MKFKVELQELET